MKPDLEFVQICQDESFKAWSHGYPFRTVRWHFHPEYELHLITRTSGKYFVGDFIGEFEPGNLVLTGPNLPHNWITDLPEGTYSEEFCTVLQFSDAFIRPLIAALPELGGLGAILTASQRGVLFPNAVSVAVEPILKDLIAARGARRIACFMDIVHILTLCDKTELLAGPHYSSDSETFMSGAMNQVLIHIAENLTDIDRTTDLAAIAGLSPSAFSRSFCKHTGMTPIKYLTRLRVDLACSLLMSDADEPITNIAFHVGFNNLSNFNRQFLALKGMSPSRFRQLHYTSKGQAMDKSVFWDSDPAQQPALPHTSARSSALGRPPLRPPLPGPASAPLIGMA
ncbi:helix-turn-helix domain-containing protein [Devosia honganensis]|uniref:Helix-turn-helix domain-containing protein n=1 Tax=Devosia honganensis TaxID=1610527 RepID=A0ABV7WYK1_9HYPH